ncbi:MAG TPA: isoprenyl transferase [Bacteroidales bacterium]|mgnify:CR=1 FL=1|nr:isoprenyl transferase [Bacteroidales bacterium]HPT09515.1 isoprenyl transferase [Bacteroidales bacterium]
MGYREQIDKKKVPVHVAVIMDGNGRWARKQGFIRTRGHEKGVDAVRNTVEAAAELGIRYLTLYAFSTENWNRPKYEIDALMRILVNSLHREMKTLMDNKIRLTAIGDLKTLPPKSYLELMQAIEKTRDNTGLTLLLALSYSSRWELLEAARTIAEKVGRGDLTPDQIDLSTITTSLTTAGIPDPELLIRTSGEYRVSNFLLWQIAYTELYFTTTLWPDFCKEDFFKAILDFQHRERRFGLTSEQLNELEGTQRK